MAFEVSEHAGCPCKDCAHPDFGHLPLGYFALAVPRRQSRESQPRIVLSASLFQPKWHRDHKRFVDAAGTAVSGRLDLSRKDIRTDGDEAMCVYWIEPVDLVPARLPPLAQGSLFGMSCLKNYSLPA
jgi:hypothetical protein